MKVLALFELSSNECLVKRDLSAVYADKFALFLYPSPVSFSAGIRFEYLTFNRCTGSARARTTVHDCRGGACGTIYNIPKTNWNAITFYLPVTSSFSNFLLISWSFILFPLPYVLPTLHSSSTRFYYFISTFISLLF